MMYDYLKSLEALWLRILASLDSDVPDISFKIYKDLSDSLVSEETPHRILERTLVSEEDIIRLYPKILSVSCRKVLVNIHRIYQVVEEYVKRMSNLFMFFRLSNIVKIKEDVSINKYLSIFESVKIDDQEFDSKFELIDSNIGSLMNIFYDTKCELFESAYSSLVKNV